MIRKLPPFLLLALGLTVLPSLAQDDAITLRYAPKVGETQTYEAACEGDVFASIAGTFRFEAFLSFDVTPKTSGDDGAITEELNHTAVRITAANQAVSSSYVGVPISVQRGADGSWLPGSESFPAPELMSGDIFTLFGQIPRLLRFPDHAVKVGEEWSFEREPMPAYFGSVATNAAGAEGETAGKTFITQKNTLTALKEYEERQAAVIRCELLIEIEGEEFVPGVPVTGSVPAVLEIAVYVDTGELIVAQAEFATEISMDLQGAPLIVRVDGAKGMYGPAGVKAPGATEGQTGRPARQGGRPGVAG